MARAVPKTKAGKQRKMAKVMREFKGGGLESSSGQKVRSRPQAIAIGLSESGQSRPPSERRRAPPGAASGRLARELSRRVEEGRNKARR